MKGNSLKMKELYTLGGNLLDEHLDLTTEAERRWAPNEMRHWCIEAEKRRAHLLKSELSGVAISWRPARYLADMLEQGVANGKIPENLASALYVRRERACLFDSFFELIAARQQKIATFCMTDAHWYLPNLLWDGFWLKPAQRFRRPIRRKLYASGFVGDNGFLLANLTGCLESNNIAIRLELRGIMSESKVKLVHALPQRIRRCIHILETDIVLTRPKQYELCQWMMPIRIQDDTQYRPEIDPTSVWKNSRFCQALFLLWLGNNELEHMLFSDGLDIHGGKFSLTDACGIP